MGTQECQQNSQMYDLRTFTLHGRLDLDIEFDGRVLNTPVYVKMDSPNDLLSSEGVCRQQGIIHYHPKVHPVKDTGKPVSGSSPIQDSADVPWVKVSLVTSVYLLPHQSVCAQVQCAEKGTTQLVEQFDDFKDSSLRLEPTLVQTDEEGLAWVILSNPNAYSLKVDSGTQVGVTPDGPQTQPEPSSPAVQEQDVDFEPEEPLAGNAGSNGNNRYFLHSQSIQDGGTRNHSSAVDKLTLRREWCNRLPGSGLVVLYIRNSYNVCSRDIT